MFGVLTLISIAIPIEWCNGGASPHATTDKPSCKYFQYEWELQPHVDIYF